MATQDEPQFVDPFRADGDGQEHAPEPEEPVVKEIPTGRQPRLSEEQYVQQELAITAAQIRAGLKDPDGKRLQRSEEYARWVYRAFQRGEVVRL